MKRKGGAMLDPYFLRPNRDTHARWQKGWWKAHSKKEMQEMARSKFRDHYAQVRRVTPRERLLDCRLGSGWGPLCEFLGKPIPDVPFPRVNEANAFREKMALVARRALKNASRRALAILVPIFVVGFAWWFLVLSTCFEERRTLLPTPPFVWGWIQIGPF